MESPDCRLDLIVPRALEERLIDFLLARSDAVPRFVSHPVGGHGLGSDFGTAGEKVRGVTKQVQITAVIAKVNLETLLGDLKAALGDADVTYWLTPLLAHGSFR